MQHAVHFRGMTGRGADERIIARGGSGEFDHCFAAWAAQGRRCEHALIIFRQPVVRFAAAVPAFSTPCSLPGRTNAQLCFCGMRCPPWRKTNLTRAPEGQVNSVGVKAKNSLSLATRNTIGSLVAAGAAFCPPQPPLNASTLSMRRDEKHTAEELDADRRMSRSIFFSHPDLTDQLPQPRLDLSQRTTPRGRGPIGLARIAGLPPRRFDARQPAKFFHSCQHRIERARAHVIAVLPQFLEHPMPDDLSFLRVV